VVSKKIQSSIENSASRSVDSEIDYSDDSFHLVLLARGESHRKIGDVAGFDANHLHPFVIRKI
jgi:hypothetical protein